VRQGVLFLLFSRIFQLHYFAITQISSKKTNKWGYTTKEEAIAIAKHRIKDRVVEMDEESTCQVEDEDLLKEIEEDERKADEEEAKATAKPKK
jgi:hypothetical protein